MAKSTKSSKTSDPRARKLGSAKLIAALNQQVGNEMHASLQYVCIASHFDRENLPRLAQFFHRQADEERMHAMKFVQFIADVGGVLRIPAISSPRAEFGSAAEAVGLSLDWEHTVTGQIYNLVEIATADRNYIAIRFLDWFVNEQLEEMNSMEMLLSLVERAGEDNLLLVEEYLGENGLAALGGGEPEAG